MKKDNLTFNGNDKSDPEIFQSKGSDKRLKIAFFDYPDVYEDFYPHYGVSQENFATWYNTANHAWLEIIQKHIGDVTWYLPSLKPEFPEIIHKKIGCRIKFMKSSWLHRIMWKSFYLPPSAWKWRKYYRSYATVASYIAPLSIALIKELWKEKPDLIFVQDYCSGKFDVLLFFSTLLNVPLVTYHSGSTDEKYLGKVLKKYSIRKSSWIFSSGSKESAKLRDKYKVDKEYLSIIYPPVDTETYTILKKEDACLKLGYDPSRRYLLFVGRFDDSVKRISSIITVFHKLAGKYPDVDLIIIGNGKDEHSLKNHAENLMPRRVIFPGWIGDDKTKALFYNIAECLLLSSWREASPAVIGEAFSCGIPVISSNVGGIEDLVIPGKTGWLFPPGEDDAMKKYLDEFLQNPATFIEMRQEARKVAEERISIPKVGETLKNGITIALRRHSGN